MYKLDRKFLRDLFQKTSESLVGRFCARIEEVADEKDLSETQKINLIKKALKNLTYESFRDLENNVKFYNEGRVYEKYKIYKPTH